jgi:hypothetical protein
MIGLLRSGIAGMKNKKDKQQRWQKPCDDPGHASLPIAGLSRTQQIWHFRFILIGPGALFF